MTEQSPIRNVLRALNPSLAHRAADSPSVSEIYAPPSHADALDPNRALVVGSRGVGKSFWAAVLADQSAREAADAAYPTLDLSNLTVHLGFHEGAGGPMSIAPPATVLPKALAAATDPAWIWRSVLLRAARPDAGPVRLTERITWLENDPETYEELLAEADANLAKRGDRLLVVFDALDVMGTDWDTIRQLTLGLARVCLEASSRKSIRLKMFMRRDQFNDMRRKTFADFSKLRTAAVELDWSYRDLYGALFAKLWRDPRSNASIQEIARTAGITGRSSSQLPRSLQESEDDQHRLFASIAGEFMGVNEKRGRTYLWVPKHLSDGLGETSLRSFLIALKEAAINTSDSNSLAIDRIGITQGVLKASETRREEIKEDHPWVEDALEPLEGLTVPCEEVELLTRWHADNTVDRILSRSDPERPAAPLQLAAFILGDENEYSPELALLEALEELGVIERRGEMRVNVPDIFRVTARIKRKGGLAPRRRA